MTVLFLALHDVIADRWLRMAVACAATVAAAILLAVGQAVGSRRRRR